MKKSSKVLSLVLAVLMAASCFTGLTIFSASAAEDTKIYFELPTADIVDWGTTKSVYCHLYNVYGDSTLFEPSWQAKATKCKQDPETGLYYFDTAKLCDIAYNDKGTAIAGDPHGGLKEGCDYGIIFSTMAADKNTYQTCNVTLSKDCLGGTIVCTGGKVENTEDSSKLDDRATWKEANLAAEFGPRASITSTGKIIGENFGKYQPKEQLVSQFIFNWAVKNAAIITSELVLADCAELGVDPMDVYNDYAVTYAEQLADPEAYPNCAPLSTVAELLNVDPNATTAPVPTEPVPTEPVPTEPAPTEPVPTEPAPTEPVPTEPVPTEPVPTEPVPAETVYVVAGSEAFCGVNWVGDPAAAPENVMTKNGDVYTLTFADAQPGESLQIKVVENLADGTQNWIGDETGNNITFNVTDVCNVTVTFDPATSAISVEGKYVEMVTDLEIEFIATVGNGDGNWLNGVAWDPADRENEMEMISDNVYQIRYTDIEEYDTYQVKFAANGSWSDNWGGVFAGFDVETEAVYNSNDNITIDTTGMELCDLILTLDLTNFNYAAKTGAVFTVNAIDKTPAKTVYGDADGDGRITITDATEIQKISVGLVQASPEQIKICDVNGDGRVSIQDVTLIQKYIADLGYNTYLVGQAVAD